METLRELRGIVIIKTVETVIRHARVDPRPGRAKGSFLVFPESSELAQRDVRPAMDGISKKGSQVAA
jgi:hypothetical protein